MISIFLPLQYLAAKELFEIPLSQCNVALQMTSALQRAPLCWERCHLSEMFFQFNQWPAKFDSFSVFAQGKVYFHRVCHLWVFLFYFQTWKSYMQKIITLKILVAIFWYFYHHLESTPCGLLCGKLFSKSFHYPSLRPVCASPFLLAKTLLLFTSMVSPQIVFPDDLVMTFSKAHTLLQSF